MKKETTKSKKVENVELSATLYNQKGKDAGKIKIPGNIFGLSWNGDLVHQVIVGMQSNMRAGTAHTKDRGEVSGGGKKPWKQKGTGRARHGSNRSPIWVGGGTTFGPRNEKDYSKKINKKMRVKALFTVLSKRFEDNQILFIDNIVLGEIKTKDASSLLKELSKIEGFERVDTKKKTGVLMLVPEKDETVEKSFSNLPGVTLMTTAELNALNASTFNTLIVVNPEESVKVLEAKIK